MDNCKALCSKFDKAADNFRQEPTLQNAFNVCTRGLRLMEDPPQIFEYYGHLKKYKKTLQNIINTCGLISTQAQGNLQNDAWCKQGKMAAYVHEISLEEEIRKYGTIIYNMRAVNP